MILAYRQGDLIIVESIRKSGNIETLRDADKKLYNYNGKVDTHRKLFDGENAVYDAIEWIGNI